MGKLIGIFGAAGSGKDTVAQFLIENHGYTKVSFAKTIKDIASIAFGWDRELLEGITKESRAWRETHDEYWGLTPRSALQKIGNEMFKGHISDDFWIKKTRRDIETSEKPVVITDCRFRVEYDFIKSMGGTVVYLNRDTVENEHLKKLASEGNLESLRDSGVHPSEWEFYTMTPDLVIHNNEGLEALHSVLAVGI